MGKEIWKPIKGFEGIYEVSSLGRIKSLERIVSRRIGSYVVKERMLTPQSNNNGYLKITLVKNGEKSQRLMHRIVAEAFIPNPNNLPVINHKNEIRDDNRTENLEWCTSSYNQSYGVGKKIWIEQYDTNGNLLAIYHSLNEASEKTGIPAPTISERLHKGNAKKITSTTTAGRYTWKKIPKKKLYEQ